MEENKEVKIIKPGESESGVVSGSLPDSKLNFWKEWPKKKKIIYLLLPTIIIILTVVLLVLFFIQDSKQPKVDESKAQRSTVTNEKVIDSQYIKDKPDAE